MSKIQNSYSAGVAAVDITPKVGVDLCGFAARTKPSDGKYDNLKAKALALSDGANITVIVASDLIGLSPETVKDIRCRINKLTGLPEDCVMITSTHTHSGPALPPLRGLGVSLDKVEEEIKTKIVKIVLAALKKMENVTIWVGTGTSEIGANRIKKPLDIDKQLYVIKIVNSGSKKVLAVIANYGCHPVVLGGGNYKISADYPGVVQKVVGKRLSAKTVMFLNGTCGDINPAVGCGKTVSCMRKVGQELSTDILRVLKGKMKKVQGPVVYKSKFVKVFFEKPLSTKELMVKRDLYRQKYLAARADPKASDATKKVAYSLYEYVCRDIQLVKKGKYPKDYNLEIHAVRIGNLFIIGIPGETFTGIGLGIKNKWRKYNVLIAGYANGDIGYIPTKAAFRDKGYATHSAPIWYGLPIFKDSIERIVVNTANSLIAQTLRK
ncbi:MAG: neutral/alkaline non-lysosomal ceramidase N-terminal domain-containing protein [Elusimicrobiota bacterium]